MAVNVALLFVFDAMAELRLKTEEIPRTPKKITNKNND